MAGVFIDPIRGALACLALVTWLTFGGAVAQPGPPAPATLRLAQVVPRLPVIHLYAIAQDEAKNPIDLIQAQRLEAFVGSTPGVKVSVDLKDGIAFVFLIDISASLNKAQFDGIKAAVQGWIKLLRPVDRAAIVTFGETVTTVQPGFTPYPDLHLLTEKLSDLPSPPTQQYTKLYQGMVQAIDLSHRLDTNLPLRRAIVVLTDGQDDQQGGASRQEVVDKLNVDPTPFYAFGYAPPNNAKPGAPPLNNAKVNEALKDFSALVRLSGGEYERVEIGNLADPFKRMRNVVDGTQHLTAQCDPACAVADGSAVAVRFGMSMGPARLSSESVKVRMVNSEGKVEQPHSALERLWNSIVQLFMRAPLLWSIVLALVLGGIIAGILAWILPRKSASAPPGPTGPDRFSAVSTGLKISTDVLIATGTRQDRKRLRLYPLGHNEIGPFDVLFDSELAVGRSPESKICIDNDPQISAAHCTLSPKDGAILVQDAGSRNGTRVNGVPINGFLHAKQDSVLGVGRTELRMQLLPEGAR